MMRSNGHAPSDKCTQKHSTHSMPTQHGASVASSPKGAVHVHGQLGGGVAGRVVVDADEEVAAVIGEP